jgi:hypothetical protein
MFNTLKLKIKTIVIVSTVIMVAGIALSMASQEYRNASWLFSSLFAIGGGIILMSSLQCLWEYFYNNRGEVTGFVFFS